MTYKHYTLVALAMTLAVIGAGFFVAQSKNGEIARYRGKAQAFDRFCTGTRISLETAIRSFDSGVRIRQEVSAEMLFRETFHVGYTSVETCLGKKTPPLPDNWTACRINNDYACMAAQLRTYHDALVKAGW